MSYKLDTNRWSMDLIYDLMSIQGYDVFADIRSLPEEEQNDFWIAYEHFKEINYWETKQNER